MGRAVAVALLAFHGWLLWQRLSGGSLLEPGVALRWAAALPLAGGLWLLRRHGSSLFRGRRAAVLWLLVVFLHFSAAAPGALEDPVHGPSWLFVPVSAPLALVLGLLAAALLAARHRRSAPERGRPLPAPLTARLAGGLHPALLARPPPA